MRTPCRENESAKFTASVDLPTPPLALETAMMWETFGMRRFCGSPRWARGIVGAGPGRPGAGFRGRPYLYCSLDVCSWSEYYSSMCVDA